MALAFWPIHHVRRRAVSVTSAAVDLLEAWTALIEEIRQAPDPVASPALGRLYQLALGCGARVLARFHNISPEDRADLVAEVLADKLRLLVSPKVDRPLGLFVTTLTCRALDHLRAEGVRRKNEAGLRDVAVLQQAASGDETDRVRGLDTVRALATLSPRDRDIVWAVALGEDRDQVALAFGTTRANVDQIYSRFRKRHGAGDL